MSIENFTILILAKYEHGEIQGGWHSRPIIAAGIRKCRRKNLGMKTRFCNRVIQTVKIREIRGKKKIEKRQ
jgi:hypothetical protein